MLDIYNSYLMSDITKIFKAKFQNDDRYQFDALFGSFLSEEKLRNADERSWNWFKAICKQLTTLEAHSVIISFMYGVFLNAKEYDMNKMHEILEEIPVTSDLNLADLCAEFFVYSKIIEESFDTSVEEKREALETAISTAKGLYFEDISGRYRVNTYSPRIIVEILPEYICSRVYDYPIDMEEFGTTELEQLVQSVLAKRKNYLEEQSKRIDERNARIEHENQVLKGELHISKIVKEKITYFDLHCVIPGIILPIFKAAEVMNKRQLCYDILKCYVLKVFSETPWEYKEKQELQIMVALLASYSDFIFSLVMQDGKWNLTAPMVMYNSDKFLEEMIGKTDGLFISMGKRTYADCSEIGTQFALLIARGKEYIRPILPKYLYSFLVAHTTFILYCTGQKDMAVKHLLKNYDDIDVADKRKLYFQVTLGRCILACEQLEAANSLYGYFNYEMDRQERERQDIFTYINSMLQFLEDAKNYIRLAEEHTFTTKESWYDILYKDGKIDALVEEIRKKNDAHILVEESQFQWMMRIIEAYSYPTGIRLGLLGLPNYDNYDKLERALSQELRMRAEGYRDKSEEYKAFFQSMNQLSIRQDANIFFQYHLSKLVRNSIEESIQKIATIRKRHADLGAESEEGTANLTEEQFESMLDDICEELSMKLQCYGSGRGEVVDFICDIQKRFIEEYCPEYTGFDLLQKLPLDIRTKALNYLVTSETVYRMLSARTDVEELDFSAALISLTKVVEIILNYIFSKMDVVDNAALDSRIRESYFWNNAPKNHIEFGPGIFLFKDAKKIIVKSETNNILENRNEYQLKHFQLWKGNDVVDISKLKKFQSIDIKVNGFQNGQVTIATIHFKNNDTHNRMLLAKGLEFIKDNYRNVGAHTEMVELPKLEEGRELLILTENMVWILLDILK